MDTALLHISFRIASSNTVVYLYDDSKNDIIEFNVTATDVNDALNKINFSGDSSEEIEKEIGLDPDLVSHWNLTHKNGEWKYEPYDVESNIMPDGTEVLTFKYGHDIECVLYMNKNDDFLAKKLAEKEIFGVE